MSKPMEKATARRGRRAFMDLLAGRRIAYARCLVEPVGGHPLTALFLCQAIYWQEALGDGAWWSKTRDEWWEETGLRRHHQERARAKLVELGMLQERREGMPARLVYRVDLDEVAKSLEFQMADGPPSSRRRVGRHEGGGSAGMKAGGPPSSLPSDQREMEEEEAVAPAGFMETIVEPLSTARALLLLSDLNPKTADLLRGLEKRLLSGRPLSATQESTLRSIAQERAPVREGEGFQPRATAPANVPTSEEQERRLREALVHDEQVLRERVEDGLAVPPEVVERCLRVRARFGFAIPEWLASLAPPPREEPRPAADLSDAEVDRRFRRLAGGR